jgi:hypothetical protein
MIFKKRGARQNEPRKKYDLVLHCHPLTLFEGRAGQQNRRWRCVIHASPGIDAHSEETNATKLYAELQTLSAPLHCPFSRALYERRRIQPISGERT